jgi:hypothetical protein
MICGGFLDRSNQEQKSSSSDIFCTKLFTFGMLSIFALAPHIRMPRHSIISTASFAEKTLHLFYKVNELCDGTLNKVYSFVYLTNVTANKYCSVKIHQSNETKGKVVDVMAKKLVHHEQGRH